MRWLSKPTKRMLFEMSLGIALYNLLLGILACALLPKVSYPVKPVLLGLLAGAVGAILMLSHMAVMTERAIDSQDEKYANKLTVAQGLLRKVAFVAALFFLWRALKIDLLAAVIGSMGMKAGAYLQPLFHRLSGGGDEESAEQTDSSGDADSQLL